MSFSRLSLVFTATAAILAANYGCSEEAATPDDDGSGNADGGGAADGAGAAAARKLAPLPSRGSTIAVSPDDTRIVAANRDVGTVTVFSVDWNEGIPTLTKMTEIAVGGEVSQVAIHPTGTFALALSRIDQKLVRIDDLRGTPKAGPSVKVGSEPTGIALTPFGDSAWIANWIDGTVSVVKTSTMEVTSTVDLNGALAASGRVGTVAGRPSLAHPRSIAITNNGNNLDDDERAYITDFYAHQKTPLAADGANADTAKGAVVYEVSVKDPTNVKLIELPALADMGFKDHKNGQAGCFPNQLLQIAVQGSFGYVLSICASPKGPLGPFAGPAALTCADDTGCPGGVTGSCVATKCTTNCTQDSECGANAGKCVANVCAGNLSNVKTTLAPAVSIIDLGSKQTIATVNLTREFETYFQNQGIADDGNRRFPLTTTDIGFVPGTVSAYVVSKGTDALFKVDFNATYEASTIDGVGSPKAPFINLAPAGVDNARLGRLPTGVAVAYKLHTQGTNQRYAFVYAENTRTVSAIDLETQDIVGRSEGTPAVVSASALPQDAATLSRREGERLFATGLGRWSMKGQGWASCESCHVDGLSDNVTWFFPRGARQPNSLDGLFNSKDPTDSRIHNWTAIQDEVSDHEMGAIRGTMGGLGAIVNNLASAPTSRIAIDRLGQAGLSGSSLAAANPANPGHLAEACVIDDWSHVTAFFKSIRTPRAPSNLDPAKVAAGRALFTEGNCQGCHGGGKWTTSHVFYQPDPSNAINDALKGKGWGDLVTEKEFPTALLPAASRKNMRGGVGGDFDQIVCALRAVDTYGKAEPEVGVAELRRDMVTAAQGNEAEGKGYNVPSLLGMAVGAPYLHAGQVRTLEALFETSPFAAHREALKEGFLAPGSPNREANIAALVSFVLSIDEDAATIAEPALSKTGGNFCSQ